MLSWGCRKLEISWGVNTKKRLPQSTSWTCLCVYVTNTPYMSALSEQGMIYLHKHTHLYIYKCWKHWCFLGVVGSLKWGVNTKKRLPNPFSESTNWTCLCVYMTTPPYMSPLCELGMIYLHKHTHIYVYICIDLPPRGIGAFLGLPEA